MRKKNAPPGFPQCGRHGAQLMPKISKFEIQHIHAPYCQVGQFEHKSSVIGPIEQTDDRFSTNRRFHTKSWTNTHKSFARPLACNQHCKHDQRQHHRTKRSPHSSNQIRNRLADRKHNTTAHKRKKSACVGLRIHKHNTIMRRSQNRHASACLLDSASSFSRQHHRAKATTNYTPSPAVLAKLSLASVVTNSHAQQLLKATKSARSFQLLVGKVEHASVEIIASP